MTDIKVYEVLLKYVNSLTEEEQKSIKKLVESEQVVKLKTPSLFDLSNLIITLKNDIRTAEAKKAGKGNLLKLMQVIIKNATKITSERIQGSHIKNDYQYVTDSIMAVRTHNILNLPKNASGDFLDCERFFNDAIANNNIPLTLPDKGSLKSYVTLQKAERKAGDINTPHIEYDFGEELPTVDAEKLMLILENTNNLEAYTSKNIFSVLYFKSEEVEIALMPIRKA